MVTGMPDAGAKQAGGPHRFVDIRRFDSIDSTNRYLLDEARAGAPEGVVAVSDPQEAGRGRLGRSWAAPPGPSPLLPVPLPPCPAVPPPALHLPPVPRGR